LAEGPDARGLSCNATGLHLAGAPLLQTTPVGFEPRADREIQALIAIAYLGAEDGARLLPGLQVVAKALNEGQFAKAMIAAVFLRLPDLDEAGARHVAETDILLRQYNPAELRDWRGWWTTGGDDGPPGANGASLTGVAYQGKYHDKLVNEIANFARAHGAIVLKSVSLQDINGVVATTDLIIQPYPGAKLRIIEVKTGLNPTFTDPQRFLYPWVELGDHVWPADNGMTKLGFPKGTLLPPMKFWLVYQRNENSPMWFKSLRDLQKIAKLNRSADDD
jgi:hypothetical protein